MGDHLHEAGEFMVSYRLMLMDMEDNQHGSDAISPNEIVTTVPNRFSGMPMMPPTLRVVPTQMETRMHMLGLMYAPSDRMTLMVMLNLLDKNMDLITYMGGMGTNTLGSFSTGTDGMGDSSVSMLYGLFNNDSSQLIFNLGLSIPTGDVKETGQILTPMNMRPTVRLPYPMQLGSGTWDLEPGLTYKKDLGDGWRWGAQGKYLTRLDKNDEGYALGDRLMLSNWFSKSLNDNVSASLRVTYTDLDDISGMDAAIALPVQAANPAYSGGERWDLGLGVNIIFPGDHRVALEYEATIDQDVNGVQMKMQNMLTLGYQLAF
ncbi:MAG: transporter [Natronospirillum sp.]